MERKISDALRKRTEIEWEFKPDSKIVQQQYDELVKIIADGLLRNENIAFIQLKERNILPNTFEVYNVEASHQKPDRNSVVKVAETLLLRHADQYQDPRYELALINQYRIFFPLRQDLMQVKLK